MSLGTAGYGNPPAASSFSLPTQLMEAAVFPWGAFVQRGLRVPAPSLPRSVPQRPCSLAFPSPRPPAAGPGAGKGPKASAGSGWPAVAEQELLWCRSLPRDRQTRYSGLAIFFQTHYFFMGSLFFSQICSIFCSPLFSLLVSNLVLELHRHWLSPDNLSSQHRRFDLYWCWALG